MVNNKVNFNGISLSFNVLYLFCVLEARSPINPVQHLYLHDAVMEFNTFKVIVFPLDGVFAVEVEVGMCPSTGAFGF